MKGLVLAFLMILAVTITPTGLSDCGEVSTSTSLSNNLSANGSCIIITGHNVKLDCAGYSITGNKTGNGINSTHYQNLTLNNCTTTNFKHNIYIHNSSNLLILNTSTLDAYIKTRQTLTIDLTGTQANKQAFHDARITTETHKTNNTYTLKTIGNNNQVTSYYTGKIPRAFIRAAGWMIASTTALYALWKRRRRR